MAMAMAEISPWPNLTLHLSYVVSCAEPEPLGEGGRRSSLRGNAFGNPILIRRSKVHLISRRTIFSWEHPR